MRSVGFFLSHPLKVTSRVERGWDLVFRNIILGHGFKKEVYFMRFVAFLVTLAYLCTPLFAAKLTIAASFHTPESGYHWFAPLGARSL